MPRLNKGVVKQGEDGLWHGRVRWTDEETGKERDKKFAPVATKTEADTLVENFKRDLEKHGGNFVDSAKVRFSELAATYKEKRLFPAKIINGRKVGGVKSPPLSQLNALVNHFGKKRIRSIMHSDIESYKLKRLDTPVIRGKGKKKTETQRCIASVNRELELMRAMMRFAVRQGWLARSPFDMGDPLISKADETRRERVLSHDEEKRLLAACGERKVTYTRRGRQIEARDQFEKRAHLRSLIIAALDTAARRGELFKLRWREVDLDARTITIIAENSKTARPRVIGITPRLYEELVMLWNVSPKDEDELVFGIKDTIKKSWQSACLEAEIEGLHFHDLRHTAITRMVKTRQPDTVIMKVSGHTQHVTFARYVNLDNEAVTNVADALATFNEAQLTRDEPVPASAMVN